MAIRIVPDEAPAQPNIRLVPDKSPITPATNIRLVPDNEPTFTPDTLPPSDFSKLGWLGKTLDILGRSSQAVKSVIKHDIEEPSITPMDVINPMSHFTRPDITAAATKGITGQEHTSMNELYEKVGIKSVPGLGFASELAVDPLMYTGGPIAEGVGKLAAPIGKGLGWLADTARKLPAVENAVTKVGEAVAPIGQQLKRAFSTSTGIPQLDELVNKYSSEKEYLRGKSMEYGIKVRKAIGGIVKRTGRTPDDISGEIVNLIELPNEAKATMPETQALANILKNHFSDTLTKEMKAGVPITALSENNRGIQYFPRITTAEAKQYFKQAQIGNTKIWNPKIANALNRRTGDFTLDEFNSFAKEHGLDSLGGKSVEQFFMKNPAYAVATRDMGSAKAVSSAQFIQKAGNVFGKVEKDAPAFWQELPDSIQKVYPALKGKKFDPEVLGEITRTYEKVFNPKEVGGFLKLFDKVQNTWKGWTLSIFPSYHIRNAVGNVWNNYLAGVVNPDDYLKASQLQEYAKTGSIKSLSTFGKTFFTKAQADGIITDAKKLGVINKGFYGADIPKTIEESVGGGNKNLLSVKGPAVMTGKAVGTTIENNARLAHFVDKLQKGFTSDSAAMSVKKYLFDYGDLTNFEKQVMKRMFPFYSWTRKNLPLQAEAVLNQPQKFLPMAKMLQGRNQADLNKLAFANPSLSQRLPVEKSRTKDSVTYIPLEGVIPGADLAKIARPQELLVEMLNPYAKTPIELLINKSFFNEKEIQKYPGETQEFLKADVPVKWKYALTSLLPQARLLKSIDEIFQKKDKTPEEWAFQSTISKVYKYNEDDLLMKGIQGISRKIDDLKKAMYWAQRNGRDKEAGRILDTINETVDTLHTLY